VQSQVNRSTDQVRLSCDTLAEVG